MAAPTPASSGGIFVSYRREDTAYPAGWLFDRLADRFGRDRVFKDVDSIEPGDDFVEVITTAVGSCAVLLVLIGDRWLTAADQEGRRRLDNPADFVRLEIETALTRKVRVIPILIDGARLPRAEELPASMAGLVRRQTLELNPSRFNFEVGRLMRILDTTLANATVPQLPREIPRKDEVSGTPSNPEDDEGQPPTRFRAVTLPDRSTVRGQDLPLVIEGRYRGDMGTAVRVILEDSYGQYYIQNPEVKFLPDGTWRATNILPGEGIMYVHFVKLDEAAKRFFDQMVKRHAFGAFREMPIHSQILNSVRIYRVT
jgi:TIR domain-containing protein